MPSSSIHASCFWRRTRHLARVSCSFAMPTICRSLIRRLTALLHRPCWSTPVGGAEGGIRTPTMLPPPAPQAGASASSATSANISWVGRPRLPARGYSGVAASDSTGSAGASTGAGPPSPLRTEPGPCWPRMARAIAPTMNSVASTVVARVSTDAPARAPNAAWLPLPPNAAAISPPFPCCRSTTTRSSRQIAMYNPDITTLSMT